MYVKGNNVYLLMDNYISNILISLRMLKRLLIFIDGTGTFLKKRLKTQKLKLCIKLQSISINDTKPKK